MQGRMERVRTGGFPHPKAALALAVAVLLTGVDFVVLRGEHIGHTTVYFSEEEPATVQVDRVGTTHLVEITSHRRMGGDDVGFRLSYWVEGPDGEILGQGSELRTREKRSFRFVPDEPGEYQVHVERDGLRLGSSGGSAQVDVYANDRRLLPRLRELIPFP